MATISYNRLLAPRNATERELHRVRLFLGLSHLNQLFKVLDVAPHNARRWASGYVNIGSPYGLRLMHCMRLRTEVLLKKVPVHESRFLDLNYDWTTHWYHFENGEDVTKRKFYMQERYRLL